MDNFKKFRNNSSLEEANRTLARNKSAKGSSLLSVYKEKNEEVIDELEDLLKKLKKEGNGASSKSVSNILGSLQKNRTTWESAIADIGK